MLKTVLRAQRLTPHRDLSRISLPSNSSLPLPSISVSLGKHGSSAPFSASHTFFHLLPTSHLLSPTSTLQPHLFPSSSGTGLICALVLALLDVPDEVIAHEYSLTDIGLAPRKEEIVQQLICEGGPLEGQRQKAERMVSASKEFMLGTLEMLREKYGSVEEYVIGECRVEREVIERLRKNLIVNVEDCNSVMDWQSHESLLRL